MRYISVVIVILFSCQQEKDYDRLIESADSLSNVGNCKASINLYNEAIKLKKTDMVTFNNRSFAYYQLGNFEKAISDVNRAVELDSRMTALGNSAYYYQNSGNHQAAIKDYNELIQQDSSAENFNNLGLSFYYLDEYDQAVLNYRGALEIDSTYSASYNNLSLIYVAKK
jgi:tetratricopeptide (TPR) repeat protein